MITENYFSDKTEIGSTAVSGAIVPCADATCPSDITQSAIEQPPLGLTDDELKDWHLLDVKAKLSGWHMRTAYKAGKPAEARLHMEAMYSANRGRIALRRLGNERMGACNFDVAGEVGARGIDA